MEHAIDEVEEDVFVVLRVALDAHDVVAAPEHLNPCFLGASQHLCVGWQLPHLRIIRTAQ